MLRFEGRTLTIRYLDDTGTELLQERWTLDERGTARGSVSGGSALARFQPLETLVS
jgi:hypothetical protein